MFGKMKLYNKEIVAFIKKGGSDRVYFDRAREVKVFKTRDKEKKKIKMLKTKMYKFEIPKDSASCFTSAGGRDVYLAYSPDGDSFAPLELDNSTTKKLTPLSRDLKLTFMMGLEDAYRRKNKVKTWQVIAPIIALAVTGVVMTFFIWASASQLIEMSSVAHGSASQLRAGMEALAEAMKLYKGVATPPVT